MGDVLHLNTDNNQQKAIEANIKFGYVCCFMIISSKIEVIFTDLFIIELLALRGLFYWIEYVYRYLFHCYHTELDFLELCFCSI